MHVMAREVRQPWYCASGHGNLVRRGIIVRLLAEWPGDQWRPACYSSMCAISHQLHSRLPLASHARDRCGGKSAVLR